MDLDLNLQPEDSSNDSLSGLESLLNEIETAHECIEERIRQLEAVTTRARQRQRWRQSQIRLQTMNVLPDPISANVHTDVELLRGDVDIATQETTFRTSRFAAENGTHLVAKALSTHEDGEEVRSNSGNFFDCNICLNMAGNPILTCCGHLFCWSCFYQLSYAYSDVKECPVCMEEVPDTGIIPIYGNGNGCNKRKCKSKECGLKVPPRPNAHRIESVRQQLLNSGAFYSPIEERIRQFSHMIVARSTVERTSLTASSELLPTTESESSQGPHTSQVSRLLFQGAASFSSLSSALNSAMDSAERLIEDLEAFIRSRHARRSQLQSSNVAAGGSLSSLTNLDTVTDNDFNVPHSTSSFRISDVDAGAVAILSPENLTTDTQIHNNSPSSFIASYSRRRTGSSRPPEVSTTPRSSSASRRRAEVPGVLDIDDALSREPRRRRLR